MPTQVAECAMVEPIGPDDRAEVRPALIRSLHERTDAQLKLTKVWLKSLRKCDKLKSANLNACAELLCGQ